MNTEHTPPTTTLPPIGTARGPIAPMPLYAPPQTDLPIDLHLDANEGPPISPGDGLAGFIAELITQEGGGEALRRYPDAIDLERRLAEQWRIAPSRVLVTAGGDESIDRACRVTLAHGRELIVPVPTFEMIPRYARLSGAQVVTPAWPEGPYPVERVLERITERTAMIAVVSPNNPTGAVASAKDLERLSIAAPEALLLVDCAYAEFADDDLMNAAIALPNAVVIRTFSKAYSMAGVRIGYAIGPEHHIRAMRSAGSPFPVSSMSLAIAQHALARANDTLPRVITRIRLERERLAALLTELGARPRPSQANFVLADFADAEGVWRGLAQLGIGVRRFAPSAGLDRSLRITCPGDEAGFDRLCQGLRTVVRPAHIVHTHDQPTRSR
jgi:histidinol-phosphate aminotransferase